MTQRVVKVRMRKGKGKQRFSRAIKREGNGQLLKRGGQSGTIGRGKLQFKGGLREERRRPDPDSGWGL